MSCSKIEKQPPEGAKVEMAYIMHSLPLGNQNTREVDVFTKDFKDNPLTIDI